MDYKQWSELLGRTTDDKILQDAIVKAGIEKIPEIEKDETDTREDIDGEGITLVFADETLLNPKTGVMGTPVLSEIIMILKHSTENIYKGSLPFDLHRDNSQKQLRHRFGEPVESNADFQWDRWEVHNLLLTVEYSEDWESLQLVAVELPRAV